MQCLGCNKELIPAPTRTTVGGKKFCDTRCQQLAQRTKRVANFLSGKYSNKLMGFPTNSWPRNLLIEHFGLKCNCCGITEWNSKPITLEVNHIDGNAAYNVLENLEFLCPNCHSQTDTYKAKNKDSARTFRRRNNADVA